MTVFIRKSSETHEFRFHSAWAGLEHGASFKTIGNVPVKVLSTGIWNNEAGPDFTNAKLLIDGKIHVGDIEIHTKSSDWSAHGHQQNPAYGNVILHVAGVHDMTDFDVSSIPHIIVFQKTGNAGSKMITPGLCSEYFCESACNTVKLIEAAGKERFIAKADKILKDMMAIGSDMAFLKSLLDAAGYKRNRDAFAELFARLSKYPREDIRRFFRRDIVGRINHPS